jgi:hypothetical protein
LVFVTLPPEKVTFSDEKVVFSDEKVTFSGLKVTFSRIYIVVLCRNNVFPYLKLYYVPVRKLLAVVLALWAVAAAEAVVAVAVGASSKSVIAVGAATETLEVVAVAGSLHGSAPGAELHAEETVLGLQDFPEFGGWHDTQELVVVVLLYLLQLQVNLVALANGLRTAFLVGGFLEAELALALIDGALLGLHLAEQWEELCCLAVGESGSLGDELLLLGLKLGGVELLSLLCIGAYGEQSEYE